MDNERYADSAQARELDKAPQAVKPKYLVMLSPEMLKAQAIREEAERVASAARVKGAIGKMERFFGYAE